MYLIFGATGRTGAEVLKNLILKKVPVRVFVRDAAKLDLATQDEVPEIIEGAVQDSNLLAHAMSGVSCIYLSMANFPGQEEVEMGIVKAAKIAGVKKIVKLSGPSAGPKSLVAIARMHGRIEAEIKTKQFDYRIEKFDFFNTISI